MYLQIFWMASLTHFQLQKYFWFHDTSTSKFWSSHSPSDNSLPFSVWSNPMEAPYFMTASYKEVSNFTFAGLGLVRMKGPGYTNTWNKVGLRENSPIWVLYMHIYIYVYCRWFRIRETDPKTSLWSLCLVCVWYMIWNIDYIFDVDY